MAIEFLPSLTDRRTKTKIQRKKMGIKTIKSGCGQQCESGFQFALMSEECLPFAVWHLKCLLSQKVLRIRLGNTLQIAELITLVQSLLKTKKLKKYNIIYLCINTFQ